MTRTIDMQDIMYLNLFSKITQVSADFCFKYNNNLMFCVDKRDLNRALGREGENLKKLSEKMNKRIRIIAKPRGIEEARSFISLVISPVQFKDLQITNNEIIVHSGGKQIKATLLGRNKIRYEEMKKVVKGFFGREYRVA